MISYLQYGPKPGLLPAHDDTPYQFKDVLCKWMFNLTVVLECPVKWRTISHVGLYKGWCAWPANEHFW